MQGGSLYKHTPQLRIVGGFPALYTKMQIWVQQTLSKAGRTVHWKESSLQGKV